VFTGTLSGQKGRIDLVSAPTYRKGDIARDAMHATILAVNSREPLLQIPSICGLAGGGDCTLLSSVQLNEKGDSDFQTGRSVTSLQYRPAVAVMGLHLASVHAPVIDSSVFSFTKVQEYLPATWEMNVDTKAITYVSPREATEVFRFSSIPLRCEVICETRAGGGRARRTATIRSVPRIKIVPEQPQSLDWFDELAFRIENFFTLCLGTSVALKQFQLFSKDKMGWVVQRVPRRSEKINVQTWVRCPQNRLAIGLASWLAVPREQRPVELTVLGMLRKSNVFLETEFLSLAQALEGVSRIQGGPSKKFAKRIEETYDLLSPDIALKVVGERTDFVAKVVATRDYFTHLGLPETDKVVRRSSPLFHLNQRLHAFLRCVMLVQHGIPEDYLKEPIQYQANRWR
jgi:hypothetical protein